MKTFLFRLTALVLGLCVLQGCENTEPKPVEDQAIRQAVTTYLNALAESYSSFSVEAIKNLASAREVEDVRRLLQGLVSTGDRLEAQLLSVAFEKISVFRQLNATVRTTEVWDVSRYDAGTGVEKGRNPTSVQQSILQLRLIDGKWKIVARRVLETQGGSKWTIQEKDLKTPKAGNPAKDQSNDGKTP